MKLVKSQVKCYKKKTKKSVGGQKKTYEYNQYLVPLKRSDKLDCSMDVFVIPQNDLGQLLDDEGQLKDISSQEAEYRHQISEYEAELAELEWKHNQLSKSYKDLFKKQNKTRKLNQELEKKVESLESDKEKLMDALRKVKEAKLKTDNQNEKMDTPLLSEGVSQSSSTKISENSGLDTNRDKNPIIDSKTAESQENKVEIDKNEKPNEIKEDKEDKDLWTVLRSRLTKKEDDEK